MNTKQSDDVPLGLHTVFLKLKNDVVVATLRKEVYFFINENKNLKEGDIDKIMDLELVKIHKLNSILKKSDRLVVIDIIDDLELFLKNHKGE